MLTFNNNDFTQLADHRYTLRDVTEALGYDWGMDDYPIFDEDYREKLNRAIWNHFALRRIASDTPSNFIFYLNRRMHEQMPNINPVYELVRRENFDPFATVQGNTNTDTKSDTDTVSQSDAVTTTRATASSTPQVFLDNPDGEQYLTGVNKQEGTSGTKDVGQQNAKGESDTHYSSINTGVGTAVYDAMAASFMATDNLVFEILEPLFMQFWDDQPM